MSQEHSVQRVLVVHESVCGGDAVADAFLSGKGRLLGVDVLQGEAPARAALPLSGVASGPMPSFVLLSAGLGDGAWLRLLQDWKGSRRYRHIPVVVLLGPTQAEEEKARAAYGSHANACVFWPEERGVAQSFAQLLCRYWMDLVTAPAVGVTAKGVRLR